MQTLEDRRVQEDRASRDAKEIFEALLMKVRIFAAEEEAKKRNGKNVVDEKLPE